MDMATRFSRPVACLALLIVLAAAGPARADAIDGHWCHSDGRKFSIDGPRIVTPSGTRTTGDYDRHAFSYTVPAGEPGRGTTISMILVDENTVRLWAGTRTAESGPGQVWLRCTDVTS